MFIHKKRIRRNYYSLPISIQVKIKDMPSNDNNAKIQFAVYQSSNSSLNTTIPDHMPTSPSQVTLDPDRLTVPKWNYVNSGSGDQPEMRRCSVFSNQSQKRKVVIVKKPLDTSLRPGWNAPPPRPRRPSYNPFSDWKKKFNESQII